MPLGALLALGLLSMLSGAMVVFIVLEGYQYQLRRKWYQTIVNGVSIVFSRMGSDLSLKSLAKAVAQSTDVTMDIFMGAPMNSTAVLWGMAPFMTWVVRRVRQ